jgi:signal transduction histidine kinase
MSIDSISALHQSIKKLVATKTTNDLYRTLVECLLSDFGFDRAGFSLFDRENHQVVGTWGSHIEDRSLRDESTHRHEVTDVHLIGPTQCEDGLVYRENITLFEKGEPIGEGWHILCGIYDKDELLGWIFIDNLMSQRPITTVEIDAIRLFATVFGPMVVKYRQNKLLSELNAHLEAKNDHLEQTILLLAKTQKNLVESRKMEALAQLVKGVAHELNTPLGNALLSVSEIEYIVKDIRKATQNCPHIDELELASGMIHRNLSRAANLITQFKRISVNEQPDSQTTINLSQHIHKIASSLVDIAAKDILPTLTINTAVDANEWLLMSSAFEQIMSNLLTNAYIHGFKGQSIGKIIVTTNLAHEKNEPLLHICISDNGVGMQEAELDALFDPFFTTNRQKGTGLGMSIVYNLVTHFMGGTITACNNEMGGLSIDMYLPAQNKRI